MSREYQPAEDEGPSIQLTNRHSSDAERQRESATSHRQQRSRNPSPSGFSSQSRHTRFNIENEWSLSASGCLPYQIPSRHEVKVFCCFVGHGPGALLKKFFSRRSTDSEGSAIQSFFPPWRYQKLDATSTSAQDHASSSQTYTPQIREGSSDDSEALSVLEFLRGHDRGAYRRLMADGFSFRCDVKSDCASYMTNGLLDDVKAQKINIGEENIEQIVFSPEKTSVAFVLKSDPVRVKLWDPVCEGEDVLGTMRDVCFEGVRLDATLGDAIGTFSTNEAGQMHFTLINPQKDGVRVSSVNSESLEVSLRVLCPAVGDSIRFMKATEDGSKALVVSQNGDFNVLQIADDLHVRCTGKFAYPCSIDHFVFVFLEETLIHISQDCKRLISGWDASRKKPVSFSLDASSAGMTEEYNDNCKHLNNEDFGYVLWASEDQTRVISQDTHTRTTDPLFFNTTDFTNCTELCNVKQMIPRMANRSAARPGWMDCVNCVTQDDLVAFCIAAVMEMQEGTPDHNLFDLLSVPLDEETTKQMIRTYGTDILNARELGKRSVLHYAIIQEQFQSAEIMVDYAIEQEVPITLCWEDGDALERAIVRRSHESVEFVLRMLSKRCTTVTEAAGLLSVHFDMLLKRFPRKVEDFLTNDTLCFEYGRFKVPVSVFKHSDEQPIAMVTDSMPTWEASSSREARKFWTDKDKRLRQRMNDVSSAQIMAASKFVCMDDAVYQDRGNLEAQLIYANVTSDMFRSDFVQTLVQWKWRRFYRTRFLLSFLLHVLVAISFSIYISNYGLDKRPDRTHDDNPYHFISPSITVTDSGARTFYGDIESRTVTLSFGGDDIICKLDSGTSGREPDGNDDKEELKNRATLKKSALWASFVCIFLAACLGLLVNTVGLTPPWRLLSNFVVAVLLCDVFFLLWSDGLDNALCRALSNSDARFGEGHICFELEDSFSVIKRLIVFLASVESISVWLTVLFYLQPLRATAPLISMIRYVISDVLYFAMLGVLVIVAFGLAFFGLLTVVFPGKDEGNFSTPVRSFETMYYAAFGQFDPKVFRQSAEQFPFLSVWTSVLFNLFLFLGGIVLLSLLIAILGDTYDRVKMTEDAELVKRRARIVGFGYGWNSLGKKLVKKVLRPYVRSFQEEATQTTGVFYHASGKLVVPRQKCFHFLVPAEPIVGEKDCTWHGKILELVRILKDAMQEDRNKSAEERRQLKQTLAKIAEHTTDPRNIQFQENTLEQGHKLQKRTSFGQEADGGVGKMQQQVMEMKTEVKAQINLVSAQNTELRSHLHQMQERTDRMENSLLHQMQERTERMENSLRHQMQERTDRMENALAQVLRKLDDLAA